MASGKIDPKECPPYLNDFFTYQRVVKIKSERTLESYYIDLRLFLRYIKLTKTGMSLDTPMNEISITDIPLEYIRDVTKLDILSYLSYVATARNNTAKTRHRKLVKYSINVCTEILTLFPTTLQKTLIILKCMNIFQNSSLLTTV